MKNLSTESQWFALVVKPRHEKAVDTALRTKGIESFLPLYSERRRWADRYTNVILPLFPGYIFSRFDPGSRSFILSTPGLFDIVRCGKEPVPIPAEEIAALQIAVNCGQPTEPWPHLAVGEIVDMDGGPMAGLSGKVLEIKNSMRLVLSVGLLNRSILIEIEREWIRPVAMRKGPSGVVRPKPLVLQHM
jgi:transcription antitermination factor NusG